MADKDKEHNKEQEHPFTGTPEEQLPDLEGERIQSERPDELKEAGKEDPEDETR